MSTTNKFERLTEKALHGVADAQELAEPSALEVALFTAAPAADDPADFTHELTVTGYARQPLEFQPDGEAVSNKAEVHFDGNAVTDASTATATHIGIVRKQARTFPVAGTAQDDEFEILLPSVEAETLSRGTVTGTGTVSGYFYDHLDPVPAQPRIAYGDAVTLVDSAASFPPSVTQDPHGAPTTYLMITSGTLKGTLILVLGRINTTTLLLDLTSSQKGWAEALTSASYILRKFPTIGSVFGTAPADIGIRTTTTSSSSRLQDDIMIERAKPHGFNMQNCIHVPASNYLEFDDTFNTAQMDDITPGDTFNFLDVVFPGDTVNAKRIYNFTITDLGARRRLTYAAADNPDLGAPQYAIPTQVDWVRCYRPGMQNTENHLQNAQIYYRSDESRWRNDTQMTNNAVEDTVIPTAPFLAIKSIVRMSYQANWQFVQSEANFQDNADSMHQNRIGRGNQNLFSRLYLRLGNQGAIDQAIPYHATKTQAGEIIWAAPITDAGSNPLSLAYDANNSIKFEAGKLKFAAS